MPKAWRRVGRYKHGPDKFLPQTVSASLSPAVLPLVHEPNLLSVEQ